MKTRWLAALAGAWALLMPTVVLGGGEQHFVWTNVNNDLPFARHLTASAVLDDKLYVIGGGNGDETEIYDRVDVYDPASNTWNQAAPLQTARMKAGATVIGGRIYVFGGKSPTAGALDSVEVYDPATNTWSFGATAPTAVVFNAVTSAQGKLWSLGSEQPGWPMQGIVELYDPGTDSWSTPPEYQLPWGDDYGSQMAVATYMDGAIEWVQFAGGVGWWSQVDTTARINAVVGGDWSDQWYGFPADEGLWPAWWDANDPNWANGWGVSSHSAFTYHDHMFVLGGDFGPYGAYNQVLYFGGYGVGWILDSHLPVYLTGRPAVGAIGDTVYVTAGRWAAAPTFGQALNTALYRGDPAPGACCNTDGTCTNETKLECDAAGGYFSGIGTDCGTAECRTGGCCHTQLTPWDPSTCNVLHQPDCNWPGDQWGGGGTDCTTASCVTGGCCHADGTCSVVAQSDCAAPDDQWSGAGTDCSTQTCCAHGSHIWADADGDGDVDGDDFAIFQLCYTGSDPAVPAGCACLDRDSVPGIGPSDFTAFSNCTTGPGVPWTPGALPACP